MSDQQLDPESMERWLKHLMEKLDAEDGPSQRQGEDADSCDDGKQELPSAITADTLAAIPDEDLWWQLTDYVQAWLNRDDGRAYDSSVEALPLGLRFAWELAGFEFEVPNGGFEQFFENSTGKYAAKLLEQFKSAGASKRAALLEKAILLFEEKGGRPRDCGERWFGSTPPEEETNELLGEYLRIAEADDIRDWFAPYVRAHPEEFFHTP